MRLKDTAPAVEKEIIGCFSAYDAQRIAHEHIDCQSPTWDEDKVVVMEQLLRAKLAQHPYVKKKLLETADYLICEDSHKDSFWGIGEHRNGQNQLGKLWMKLREELKANK